ncbi:MAG: helix-turn-helix domain-containing protein [Chloroflexota bacterium]|nr:helix-turn-helix domain-containing protein [Chloroflexota bacterium]
MTQHHVTESEWVSLREAASLLGVHPATVRNWADKGELASRRTPGGHRRFRKADLIHYAAAQGDVQPLEVQVIIQNALGQARMDVSGGGLKDEPWYQALGEPVRGQLRDQGRAVLEALRGYLNAGAPDVRLAEPIRLGTVYAVALQSASLTLPQAVRAFFYFSDFVTNAVLSWSEIAPRSANEWATLIRQINHFMNTMMLSILEYYEEE